MTTATPISVERDAALVALMEPIRRVAAARGADSHTVDDVVQETLVRLMAQRERLADDALLPYALVTARNLVATAGRDVARGRRHAHRLVDLREPDRPEDLALRREEERALATALAGLSPDEREILLRHEVAGEDTASIAAESRSTPGSVAARLARSRAKLRVDFLLQLRGVVLPTARCRPVLLALAAGDQRRQHSLGAGRHLLTCTACTELSQPLIERRRALAGLVPWLGLGGLANALRYLAHSRKAQLTTAAAAAGTAAVVGVAVAATPTHHAPAPSRGSASTTPVGTAAAARPALAVDGKALLPLPADRLAPYAGQTVTATGVLVQSVAADEGFWVGQNATDRVWVQLRLSTSESPEQVRVGERVSFVGTVVANPPGFAERVGVNAAEGAAQLTRQGAHISANGDVIHLG
ncbi:MAG: sigma-70 family RNA polymerase sigma factor [Mycobacteriales bacterium]